MGQPNVSQREFDVEKFATRREFDQLQQRVESMDSHGTRGVGILQEQITNLVRDITEIKTTVDHKFRDVDDRFELQRQERLSGRRWLIGIGIAGVSALAAVLAILVAIFQQVHLVTD